MRERRVGERGRRGGGGVGGGWCSFEIGCPTSKVGRILDVDGQGK